MFALTVCDHVMIAHSFSGAVFGPAQRLHGATYVVEAELRRAALDADGLVCDIGVFRRVLRAALDTFDYRNLDELPQFSAQNTTTEFMAQAVHRMLAARIAAGELGAVPAPAFAALKVTLRESPLAWASFEGPLG